MLNRAGFIKTVGGFSSLASLTLVACIHAAGPGAGPGSAPGSYPVPYGVAPPAEQSPPVTTEEVPTEVLQNSEPVVTPAFVGCSANPAKFTPPSLALPNGGVVKVAAYGYNNSARRGVSWDQPYPAPCFDDDASRKGLPNAAWQGDYWLEGKSLCFLIHGLHAQYPPSDTIQVGYSVQLTGATFANGGAQKNLVLAEYRGVPAKTDIRACVPIVF